MYKRYDLKINYLKVSETNIRVYAKSREEAAELALVMFSDSHPAICQDPKVVDIDEVPGYQVSDSEAMASHLDVKRSRSGDISDLAERQLKNIRKATIPCKYENFSHKAIDDGRRAIPCAECGYSK